MDKQFSSIRKLKLEAPSAYSRMGEAISGTGLAHCPPHTRTPCPVQIVYAYQATLLPSA